MLPGTLPASGSSLGSPSAKPVPPFQCPRLESHLLIPSSGAQDLGPPLQLCSFSNRGFYPYWCHGTPLASSEGYVPTSEYFQIKHTEENANEFEFEHRRRGGTSCLSYGQGNTDPINILDSYQIQIVFKQLQILVFSAGTILRN